MLFTSPVFFIFFVVVFLVSLVPMGWTARKAMLLLASYVFYASWNPPFVILLWISTLMDFFLARRIAATQSAGARKALICVTVVVNLGILCAFKYANFFADNFSQVAGIAGWQVQHTAWSIVLPLGISFYTFQTMSYTIDVYRGTIKPTRSLLDFALFVTFFPQLVAGPIVRAGEFLYQLESPRRATAPQLYWGVLLFIVGFFKKSFLADSVFAPVANLVYLAEAVPTTLQAWAATYAFAGQIYCDFSGYTDMAIACALMLGFTLPDNFRAPYGAVGFSDFWRRWHISLSSWLRDYLYIPLGGNRKGPVRTRINLMLTMLLGGLWHGASWTFVAWGGLHGGYLVAEQALRRWLKAPWLQSRIVRFLLMLLTFHLVCVAWVFFRAESFECALEMLGAMSGIARGPGMVQFSRWTALLAVGCMAALVGVHWIWRDKRIEELSARAGWFVTAIIAGVMLFLTLTAGGSGAEFIYFQF